MRNEHRLQSACVAWFRLQYPRKSRLLFSIPNGAMRRARIRPPAGKGLELEINEDEN